MRVTLPCRRAIYADDHDAFRDSVRGFVAAEIVPHLDDWRRNGQVPRSVLAASGRAGFLGTAVPETFGGGGTEDLAFLAVLVEEAVAVGATGVALIAALHAGVVIPYLLEHGSDADNERLLPGLATGELIAVPAPAGSLAVDDGRLTGSLSSVPGARCADILLLDSRVGPHFVETANPAIRITAESAGLGAVEAGLADVALDTVPATAATTQHVSIQPDLDLWFSVLALAGARTAVELAVEYATSRKVFGRPLAEFQNTRFRLAEIAAELITATTFVDHCVSARGRGELGATDAAAARLVTTSLHDRAVDQSLQLHGGYGYMREYPIAQAFADARFLRLAAQCYSDPRGVLAPTSTDSASPTRA
jgi:acyl-CoA dehydrogenase